MIVKELKIFDKRCYQIYISSDNNYKKVKEVCVKYIEKKMEDGSTKFLIYGNRHEPIETAYYYVNDYKSCVANNTRRKVSNALCFFFAFMEIRYIKNCNFTMEQGKEFVKFLQGTSKGKLKGFELKTSRNAKSANEYLGYIRNYLEYLGIEKSVFNRKRKLFGENKRGSVSAKKDVGQKEEYVLKAKEGYIEEEKPSAISKEMMITILEYIREYKTLREEILVRLQFEAATRIGEGLGITFEDLQFNKRKLSGMKEDDVVEIHLRNRVSDRYECQSAKSCMKINSYDDYFDDSYHSEGIGYHKVFISVQLARVILSYVSYSRNKLTKVTRANYLVKAKADRVVVNDYYAAEDNYYLFLNKDGGALHSGWNDVMKDILEKCDIHLKSGDDKKGINHIFRHGFAEFLREEMELSTDDIAVHMRHANPETTRIYLKRNSEEKQELFNNVAKMRFQMLEGVNK